MIHPSDSDWRNLFALFLIGLFYVAVRYARSRRTLSRTAHGTAEWLSERSMEAAGFFGRKGLILARTLRSRRVIRLRDYTHILLCGGTGSGKGIGCLIVQLLSYVRSSVIAFDTKGDLWAACAKWRAEAGQRIIRLAPFDGGTDTWNVFDTIKRDDPLLVDLARAMADSLVTRKGTENEEHFLDRSVDTITGLSVLVLLESEGAERSLNTVADMAASPELLEAAADRLIALGGKPARLGSKIKALFSKEDGGLSKEGASVMSTVGRFLAFLDSDLVEVSLAASSFNPEDLRQPGTTLFLQIPPKFLISHQGLLRCWTSTLIRVIGEGNEATGEVLCLFDEASALNGLPALEEALIRGRSAGVRLLLAYQSDSQVKAAFKDKPTLIYDNCSSQIYLANGITSIESAERLAKTLGNYTRMTASSSESSNESRSGQAGGGGWQAGNTAGMNWSVHKRSLLTPEEILVLPPDIVIALCKPHRPILARMLRYYRDPLFNPAMRRKVQLWWIVMLIVAISLVVWGLLGR